MKKYRLILSIVILIGGGVALFGFHLWTWIEAGEVMLDVSGLAPKGAMPRQTVSYDDGDRTLSADLYPPAKQTGAGIVLVPGASPSGKDDPRMIAFASALSRAGFAVLVPDIADERVLRVGPGDERDIVAAVRRLHQDEKRIGVAAISYGVGPAILAALDHGDDIAFVVGVGGYYDIEAVVRFFTTGWYFENGAWAHRVPNVYGRWVFAKSNAARLTDPSDRALLEMIADKRMQDPEAPVDSLAARLTTEGRAVYALLVNTDKDRVPGLIDALPQGIKDDIRALDLSHRDLSHLSADLVLVHGQDDPIIPSGESRKLAAAVPSAKLFILEDLAHTNWGKRSRDGFFTLLRTVRAVLDERRGGGRDRRASAPRHSDAPPLRETIDGTDQHLAR